MGEKELLGLFGGWLMASPFLVLLGGGWLLWRTLTRGWSALPRMPGAVGLVAAGMAGCAYIAGVFSVPWFDPGNVCPSLHLHDAVVKERIFPMSAQCMERGADSGVELVPGWVNPVVVVGLLVAVTGFAVAAVRWAGRQRAERRYREELAWAEMEAAGWQLIPDQTLLPGTPGTVPDVPAQRLSGGRDPRPRRRSPS
ncbi:MULTISPECIES: hypothetical protein [unclassified Kitasatospora]|uniref:hypothetical protein n=1 Tax=unclassified Kitasatospora TaxID=2633591 RepID=UPI00070DF903|nr:MULTISPECIES: hypothetical protein [unclassified Kitasatospora]KQV16845.1 hypothetical protein ASC99_27150 [Kitasatospora sp. Root107]KRB73709.1 hypothetical protein ASE03_21175 [Kitasatospora sp. Root187]